MAAEKDGVLEVLIDWGKSKEVLKIKADDIESYVKSKLPSSSSKGPLLLPFDETSPRVKGTYILQKWSERWQCCIDCGKEDVEDGDKLSIVECDCEVSNKAKSICQSLAKPSEATAKSLSKLFPGSMKRKFDPFSASVNSESKRKKKAAFPLAKGRPKQIQVVYLASNPSIIPKGKLREKVRGEGRIKDLPFHRNSSREDVIDLINFSFPTLCKNFVFLQGHKDNSLTVASNQELDGNGVIDLVKHGSLYLLESLGSDTSDDHDTNAPANVASSSKGSVDKSPSLLVELLQSDLPSPPPSNNNSSLPSSVVTNTVSDSVPPLQHVLPKGYSYEDCVIESSDEEVVPTDKNAIDEARNLRMEQDFEYFKSLEIDRAKEISRAKERQEQEKEKNQVCAWKQKIADLRSSLKGKFADQPSQQSGGASLSFKLYSGATIAYTFTDGSTLKDVYQFVALHIDPPFVLCLPHPHKLLPLCDFIHEPAKSYDNHLFMVEWREGYDSKELMLLSDESSIEQEVIVVNSPPIAKEVIVASSDDVILVPPPVDAPSHASTSSSSDVKEATVNNEETKRLAYMKDIATPGELRTVDRDNIYEDVVDMYRIGEVVGEYPIKIKYSTEQAIDDGGVQRDMFSAFWDEAFKKLFEGATCLVPMVHPHIDMTIFPILGRILSHGYLVTGDLPVRIVLPTLIGILLGQSTRVTQEVLLDAFLDYISSAERHVFKEALCFREKAKFMNETQVTLLDVLSRFGCRDVPTPNNLMSTIGRVAEYEFLIKPAAAIALINSGIPTTHRKFWEQKTVSDVVEIHEQLTVTSQKVLNLLMSPDASTGAQSRVYSYFTTMIGNMNPNELRSLLRFITGSSVCSASKILVEYNGLSGFERRPIAHTCDSAIELPTTYMNYKDFYDEFQAILSEVHKEYTLRMDAL